MGHRSLLAAALFLVISSAALAAPSPVAAACLRISGGIFNAAGDDNLSVNLNGEYVIVKNACSTSKLLTGWRINDYGVKHTYRFPTGYRLAAYASVKVHSGRGTNGARHLYWQRTYGAVWNNTAPERAYLRNSAGTLISSWSLY
jgi:hypothetical protein